ncbi:cytidylate kinase [Enterococcus sp. PF1-24]|uniref:(d)CMP kinase n=1 Tax=unclassified Enterococcus TaxID=2608891 RepID=UPI0024733689|nr:MULTISPECIES: (d)CMP kinase [unclassified Enterococcus]MDH6363169.1 cytidylate kinase [Enterococcus sp. PFB1-1]MDH6400263.1 cytidylate kinase [Enterococcus sp. PF1-24]
MKKISIAIDGPASSGKSTVAKILAKDFNYIYLDTGAMYRAVTYLAIQNQVGFSDEEKLAELIDNYEISFKQADEGQLVFTNQEDVTLAIRQPEVTNAVSEVSAQKIVREKLVEKQQAYGVNGGVVMDGRDIGTAVLPNAEVKIFLIASVEERAQRRYKENLAKGINTPLEQLQAEIQKRDHLDSTREISPLVKAEDAIELDTTGLSVIEVVAAIKEIIFKKSI